MRKILQTDAEYPKFNRLENKSCKLSNLDIQNVQNDFKQLRNDYPTNVALYKHLATKYNVHYQTIHYWVNADYRKKILENSLRKSVREWKEQPDKVKARMRKYKSDWRIRKAGKLKEYNHSVVNERNKAYRAFVALHKDEYEEFLKTWSS